MCDYILRITLLESPWNVNLTSGDFAIETETPLRLKRNGSLVVLFYGEDDTSIKALTAWSKVAQMTIGPIFASCNLRSEKPIANKILDTGNTNPSLRWTNNLRVPYILAYSNTWPIGKYTGPIDETSISNWALTVNGGDLNPSMLPTATTVTVSTVSKPTESETVVIPKTL